MCLGIGAQAATIESAPMLLVVRQLVLFAAIVAALPAEEFAGKVVAITDGDTIKVMRGGGAERVRLWVPFQFGLNAIVARINDISTRTVVGPVTCAETLALLTTSE